MKSKTPLVLIEQTLMLLIFAVAAVFCIQAFIRSDVASKENEYRDAAYIHAQNMAETLKNTRGDYAKASVLCGGEWDGERWSAEFDGISLYAESEPDTSPYLSRASVFAESGEKLLTVSWQEVTGNE